VAVCLLLSAHRAVIFAIAQFSCFSSGDDGVVLGSGGGGGASLYFGHSSTLVPLMTALGLFRDRRPLTAGVTPPQRRRRLFRTSRIDPMSANIAFTLYHCHHHCQPPVTGIQHTSLIHLPISTIQSAVEKRLITHCCVSRLGCSRLSGHIEPHSPRLQA